MYTNSLIAFTHSTELIEIVWLPHSRCQPLPFRMFCDVLLSVAIIDWREEGVSGHGWTGLVAGRTDGRWRFLHTLKNNNINSA